MVMFVGVIGCVMPVSTPGRSDLVGRWLVDDIDNRPVVSNSSATIEFTQDDRVVGNASCNRFVGSYVLSGSNLSFGQLATTKKMCTGPLMEQENRFLDALSQVTGLRFEQGRLFLLDGNGTSVTKASRKKEAK